jgi:hypothetical protein
MAEAPANPTKSYDPRIKGPHVDMVKEMERIKESIRHTHADDGDMAMAVAELRDEALECRACLDPGKKVKCCKEIYCDECYYKNEHCQSCGVAVAGKGRNVDHESGMDLNKVPKRGSWAAHVGMFYRVSILSGVAYFLYLLSMHYRYLPATVHGKKCTGAFPVCTPLCVDATVNHPFRYLGHTEAWKSCDLGSEQKIRSAGCIYDQSLYRRTGGRYGYDFCQGNFQKMVIVFEDFFDIYEGMYSADPVKLDYARINYRSRMASGQWAWVVSGAAAPTCGSSTGTNAMFFSGGGFFGESGAQRLKPRELATPPVNVENGGEVRFKLYYSDGARLNCNELFGSDKKGQEISLVWLQWGVYNPNSEHTDPDPDWFQFDPRQKEIEWHNIKLFRSSDVKGKDFVDFNVTIPEEAHLPNVQFRWTQPTFEESGDSWAIDDVQIAANFGDNWESTIQKELKDESTTFNRKAQCCLDSWECHTKQKSFWKDECADFADIDGHRAFNLQGNELWVVLGLLGWLFYQAGSQVLLMMSLNISLPFVREIAETERRLVQFMTRLAKKIKKWSRQRKDQDMEEVVLAKTNFDCEEEVDVEPIVGQIYYVILGLAVFTMFTLMVLALTYAPVRMKLQVNALQGGHGSTCDDESGGGEHHKWVVISFPYIVVAAIAVFLDVKELYFTGSDVFCVLPQWHAKCKVEARSNTFQVFDFQRIRESVKLNEFGDKLDFPKVELQRIAASYFIMSLPWASLCLLSPDRTMGALIGCIVVMRAWFRASIMCKVGFVVKYFWIVFRLMDPNNDDDQQQFGESLVRPYTLICAVIWTVITVGFGLAQMYVLQGINRGWAGDGGPVPEFAIPLYWPYDTIPTSTNPMNPAFLLYLLVGCGFFLGTAIAVLQGLPVVPNIIITKFDIGTYYHYRRKADFGHAFGHVFFATVQTHTVNFVCTVKDTIKLKHLVSGQIDNYVDDLKLPDGTTPPE